MKRDCCDGYRNTERAVFLFLSDLFFSSTIMYLQIFQQTMHGSAGITSMSPNKLVENIVAISSSAVPKIPRKWANIQEIAIKTPESVSLPIYNKTPQALMEIAKLAGIKPFLTVPSPKAMETIDKAVVSDGQEKDPEDKKDADESEKDDAEASSKRKRDMMKSPLIRALKKQKKPEDKAKKNTVTDEEKEETADKTKETQQSETKENVSSKKQRKQQKKEVTEGNKPSSSEAKEGRKVEKDDLNKAKEKVAKSKKGDEKAKEGENDVEPKTPKQQQKKEKRKSPEAKADDTRPNDGSHKKRKGETAVTKEDKKSDTPSPADGQEKKKVKTPNKSATTATSTTKEQDKDGGETKEFVAAKKFKGSKKGCVFKMGPQGLGYYKDVPPVVDKMALQAILRVGQNSKRRGGQKKNKYKGTRRF